MGTTDDARSCTAGRGPTRPASPAGAGRAAALRAVGEVWRACGGSGPRQVPDFACLWRCNARFAIKRPMRPRIADVHRDPHLNSNRPEFFEGRSPGIPWHARRLPKCFSFPKAGKPCYGVGPVVPGVLRRILIRTGGTARRDRWYSTGFGENRRYRRVGLVGPGAQGWC
jgi:hypothetical protein